MLIAAQVPSAIWASIRPSFANFQVSAVEVSDEQVGVLVRSRAPTATAWHHFVVRGGLIVRFERFVDTALVRDAMTP